MLQTIIPLRYLSLVALLLTGACASDHEATDAGLGREGGPSLEGGASGTDLDGGGTLGDGAAPDSQTRDGSRLSDGAIVTGDGATIGTDGATLTGVGPAPVLLGSAGNFVILAKAAIANAPTSAVTGDLGLSPAAGTYITGFSLTRVGTKWTSAQVTGSLYAADNDPPSPSNLTTAVADMETAYTDAAGRPTPMFLNLGAGTIGGMTLSPGLYTWTSSVTIPTDLTIAGAPNDTWIFQIAGDLSIDAAKRVTLTGGAAAKNIVWQVAGAVTLGTTSHLEGVVLSQTAITLRTGASLNGRLYAQTAVNLDQATVVAPAL